MILSWLDHAGTVILALLQGFGRFWYRFIIGDDWTLAATIAAALVMTWLLHTAGVAAWWLPPLAAVTVVGASLRRASRPPGGPTRTAPVTDTLDRSEAIRTDHG
jgi:hypothetical protein